MLIGCLCSQFMEECRSVAYLCHVYTPQLIGCEGKNSFIKGKEENSFLLLPFLLLAGMKMSEVACSCISPFALLEREQAFCDQTGQG